MEISQSKKELLRKYHSLTSPLQPLHAQQASSEVKLNASLRLDCIKNRSTKHKLEPQSFTQLKAGAILYQVPQFSTPEVNFQVAEQIKRKVDQVKNDLVTRLPDISKSSNYAPRKLEHQLGHRSAIKEVEEWLRESLKNPPTSAEETLEYKQMIMGVGMKELVRVISKRCQEEGRMAEEIWELTWAICREIILNLSRRAKKCQEVLSQELQLMRMTYQEEFQRLQAENQEFERRVKELQAENKDFFDELNNAKRRKEDMEQQNKGLTSNNFYLQEEFRNVLQENLAIYLQIGDRSKRGWIKKMYKNIAQAPRTSSQLHQFYKERVSTTIDLRNQLEQVTGEPSQALTRQDIQKIGSQIISKMQKIQQKKERQLSQGEKVGSESQIDISDCQSDRGCKDFIKNMKEQFLSIDRAAQTEKVVLTHAYAATPTLSFSDFQTSLHFWELEGIQETGVNTEEFKDCLKLTKKKGKENLKEEKSLEKSKASSSTSLRKTKPKPEKEKTAMPEIAEQPKERHSERGIQQSVRLSEPLQIPDTFTRVKTEVNRHSQGMAEFKKEVEFKDSNISERKSERSKMVSIFKKKDSQNERLSSIATEQKNESKLDKSIVVNIYSKDNLIIPEKEEAKEEEGQKEKEKEKEKSCKIYPEENPLDNIKECTIYICANCNKIIRQGEPKMSRNSPRKFTSMDHGNRSKRTSQRSANLSSLKSLKKLALFPIDSKDEGDMDHRRGKKIPSRRSSGYLHDIAFKKDLEGQAKSIFNRMEGDQGEEEEQKESRLIVSKDNCATWLTSQLLSSNKQWIESVAYNQALNTDGLDQYLQIVKQVNAVPAQELRMTQKLVISTIQKNIFPILNELLVLVRKAVKTGKVPEVIRSFTSLPSIVYNRICRKYGVKFLALKHLRILLLAFRTAAKFTQKYKTIELMMLTDCKSPHSEDLFVYLLLMGLYDPSYSATKTLAPDQLITVREVCEANLSRDKQVYGGDWWTAQESVSLNDLVRSVLTNYRLLKINRIEEFGFIYLMLKRDHWLDFRRFVTFLNLFKIDHAAKVSISKKLLQFCDLKSKDQKIGISENMFAKFLTSCEIFTLNFLEAALNDQIAHSFKEKDSFAQLKERMFNHEAPLSRDQAVPVPENVNNSSSQLSLPKATSAPEIRDSKEENIFSEGEVMKDRGEKIAPYLRSYSQLSYQLCSYLQNQEETKFLGGRQRSFIKNYLMMHVLEHETEAVIGLGDYFSDSMLGLVCASPSDFQIARPEA